MVKYIKTILHVPFIQLVIGIAFIFKAKLF